MTRTGLGVLAAIGLLLAPLSDFAAAQATRRALYASVLDATGAPVTGVNPEDLTVREDKVVREVLEVWPASDPMDLAILVDNSQAAERYISDYRAALRTFITGIGADDTGARHQVALITLADRPTIMADYSLDLKAPLDASQRIFSMPGSGTYLLDGIIETSRGFTRRNARRPVIVVITTEGPELSSRPYSSVLEPLRASGAQLHVLIVGSPRNTDTDRSFAIGMGTKSSGGSSDTVFTGTALVPRLERLATELTHQFKVIYSRPQSLIPPEQITIDAAKPGLTVRGTPVREPGDPR